MVVVFALILSTLVIGPLWSSSAQSQVVPVPKGGNLQAAVNAAATATSDTTIVLDAGAAYPQITLPKKSSATRVTIQTSAVASLPAGVRVGPSQSSLFAKIQATVPGEPAISTVAGANGYSFVGIEVSTNSPSLIIYTLVQFGSGGSDQNSLSQVPTNLSFDRGYIHGFPTQEVQRGIGLNSANTSITNSYISDVHGKGYDTQAICGWNGPGPYVIVNNYLEGSGENVMFGGSPASIPNLVPSDITFKRNLVVKPLSWYVNDPSFAGIKWTVKNLFELKNSRRVVVDGNVFENNWTDAQAGRAIVFTPRPSDSGVWALVEDVQFTNNIVRNVGSGVLILGADEPPAPTETRLRRIRVANNLWENIDGPRFGSNGFFATVVNKTEDVTIEHNTAIQTGNIIGTDYNPNVGFVYRDNITRHNEYGIFGSRSDIQINVGGIGNPAIEYFFPGSQVVGNVIAKEVMSSQWNVAGAYPAGNYFPESLNAIGFVDWTNGNYRLASHSPYLGAAFDGTNPGVDMDALNAALNGIGGGPTPTPSPSPSPLVESPSGTRVPTDALQIVDDEGVVWTLADNGTILRNGSSAQGGSGSVILYCNHVIYVFGDDSQWWRWSGGWITQGTADPCGATPTPTPDPQPSPSPSPSPDGKFVTRLVNEDATEIVCVMSEMDAQGFSLKGTVGHTLIFERR